MESSGHLRIGKSDEALEEPLSTTAPSESTGFDVFLSHNHKDKPEVRLLTEALRQRGLRPWLDEDELTPGRSWQQEIDGVLRTIPAAAVLVGADGLGPWENVEMEACLAQMVERKIPVIPVLLPDAPQKPDLPLFLHGITWVDLRDGFSEEGLDRLVRGIKSQKPARRKSRADKSLRWLVLNLFLVALLLILSYTWCAVFTDWPKIVVGLTLTGVFGLLALAARILLPEATRGLLQRKIDAAFLRNPRASYVLAALLALGTLTAACVGSVRLDAARDSEDFPRQVKLYGAEEDASLQPVRGHLPAKAQAKLPLLMSPFGAAKYWIEVSDLPPILRELRPREILRLEVPDDFFSRPAVLVRPDPRVSNTVHAEPAAFDLRVRIDGETFSADSYRGQAIWIGVPEIAIPSKLREPWKDEVADPAVERRWLEPIAVAPRRLLKAGEQVTVEILKRECRPHHRSPPVEGCDPYVSTTAEVLRLESFRSFPQVLELNEKN